MRCSLWPQQREHQRGPEEVSADEHSLSVEPINNHPSDRPQQEHWDEDTHGRLLLIDDADRLSWNDIFLRLQDTLRHGPVRTRVLLAARATGWWWSSTRQRIADFDHEVTDLELDPTLADRAESFTLACRHFAKQLGVTAPDESGKIWR